MCLNSYKIKLIALITMIIDHTAVVFSSVMSKNLYQLMRGIGRLSFPLFAFLLVEGFTHTSNRKRYLMRLGAFCLISEIPYDLVLRHRYGLGLHQMMDWSKQNVFFTLALAFIAMMVVETYGKQPIVCFLGILGFAYLGDIIHCDYGSIGVITVVLFYYCRKYYAEKYGSLAWLVCLMPLVLAYINAPTQKYCLFSVFFIFLYNGEKGKGLKYLFYISYPVHLLILLVIKNFYSIT